MTITSSSTTSTKKKESSSSSSTSTSDDDSSSMLFLSCCKTKKKTKRRTLVSISIIVAVIVNVTIFVCNISFYYFKQEKISSLSSTILVKKEESATMTTTTTTTTVTEENRTATTTTPLLLLSNNNNTTTTNKVTTVVTPSTIVAITTTTTHQKGQRVVCDNSNNTTLWTDYNCEKVIQTIPKLRSPSIQHVLLIHIGKAGGGTASARLLYWHRMNIRQCHPKPCSLEMLQGRIQRRPRQPSTSTSITPQQQRPSIIITIRDPVDRFVSAFYYDSLLLCNPNGDKRRRVTLSQRQKNSTWLPQDICINGPPGEATMIYQKYQNNVSLLAEAMCHHNNRNKKEEEEVFYDLQRIEHTHYELNEWMPWYYETTNTTTTTTTTTTDNDRNIDANIRRSYQSTMTPIVLEHGFNFNVQVDQALLWVTKEHPTKLLVEGGGRDARQSSLVQQQQRYAYKICQDCHLSLPMKWMEQINRARHTSSSSSSSSTNKPKKAITTPTTPTTTTTTITTTKRDILQQHNNNPYLTPHAEYCAVQYYRKDYELLRNHILPTCKFPECTKAIEQILNRRSLLLSF